ncbi:hypothetical protein H1S01_03075 [Heliobacterium chlorum]|uniref:Uncharacterized protein n=1 Tax=Heliobacterium chlorum TaxID=2698 RepID=A0ABR7SY82_HELCL|nr:hypothetical protein [Heliobacterium chlorum]MBC9783493.1 hypothetical protein [Heliobacterium chlorum]
MSASAWVPCLHCQRGPKAEQSCSSGLHATNLKLGCFSGEFVTGKEPKAKKSKDGERT